MKVILVSLSLIGLLSFSTKEAETEDNCPHLEFGISTSFKLINDTKEKVDIHTGIGFVSLNKGSSTSVGCNFGKEVRWAKGGKKGDIIFKIESKHCGKTMKLSEMMK
ncbi:MAG: hypothetical protein ABI295_05255 [Xanthomarina sp.]